MFLARTSGVNNFGKFSIVQIIVSSFMTIADLGLTNVIVRSIAREQDRRSQLFASFLMLRLLLGLLTVGAVIPVSYLIVEQSDTRRLVLIYALSIIPFSLTSTCLAAYNGSERMGYSIIPVLWNIISMIISIIALATGHSLQDIFIILLACQILSAATSLYIINRSFFTVRILVFEPHTWYQYLSTAAPFGFMTLMGILGVSVGPMILSRFSGETSIGYFSVASKLNTIFMIFIGAYNTAIYPTLVRLEKTSQSTLQRAYKVTMKLLIIVGLPATVGLNILAERIISISFPDYTPATHTFQALVWFSFFSLLSTICLNMLYAEDRQRDTAVIMFIATALCIVLSYILIPLMGILGAGLAQICLTAVQYLLSYRKVARKYRINTQSMIYQALPGLAFVLFAGLLTRAQNIILGICSMLVAFSVSLLCFHPFDLEEQDILRTLPLISRLETAKSWISSKLLQMIEPRGS